MIRSRRCRANFANSNDKAYSKAQQIVDCKPLRFPLKDFLFSLFEVDFPIKSQWRCQSKHVDGDANSRTPLLLEHKKLSQTKGVLPLF